MIAISIDVPDLAEGVRFYTSAFGFTVHAEPYPGVTVLRRDAFELCLLAKPAGSKPSPSTNDARRYDRHWTPVHLDFHVADLRTALAAAIAAGATQEQLFEHEEHGSAAFCSDPFGHGFCLLETRR